MLRKSLLASVVKEIPVTLLPGLTKHTFQLFLDTTSAIHHQLVLDIFMSNMTLSVALTKPYKRSIEQLSLGGLNLMGKQIQYFLKRGECYHLVENYTSQSWRNCWHRWLPDGTTKPVNSCPMLISSELFVCTSLDFSPDGSWIIPKR